MTSTEEYATEEYVVLLADWAAGYPSARFVVIAIAPDDSDAAVLGWGLALPEYVFTHLPEVRLNGTFRTADDLLRLLNRTINARIAWIDPEPQHCPDGLS